MSIKSDRPQAQPEQTKSFLSAWEQRKRNVLLEKQALENEQQLAEKIQNDPEVLLTDEDMPSIDTLTEDSDYTGFLSPKVSEPLRKMALRKLFQSAEFNICDGLDDYDEDYTSFAKLGDIITSDLKHQMEVAARKKIDDALEKDKKVADASQIEQTDQAAISEQSTLPIEDEETIEEDEKKLKRDDHKQSQHELEGNISE